MLRDQGLGGIVPHEVRLRSRRELDDRARVASLSAQCSVGYGAHGSKLPVNKQQEVELRATRWRLEATHLKQYRGNDLGAESAPWIAVDFSWLRAGCDFSES